MEIKHSQVVVSKRKQRRGRLHAVTSNCTDATEELKPGFSAIKHCVKKSKDDKEADVGNATAIELIFKNSFAAT